MVRQYILKGRTKGEGGMREWGVVFIEQSLIDGRNVVQLRVRRDGTSKKGDYSTKMNGKYIAEWVEEDRNSTAMGV